MPSLTDLVDFCDLRTRRMEISDFPGAFNGLQLANDGSVSKIGASVDAGLEPFLGAVEANVDFLIVHHGLFWNPPVPLTGTSYQKIKLCLEGNLSLYGSHLPLDMHPEIGNNAILRKKLGLEAEGTFLDHEGVDIGLLAKCSLARDELKERIATLFPMGFHAMEFGSEKPERIAILTGSGSSAVEKILDAGSDTLITGELKQHHYNLAQELNLNLYVCGHYATETYGVDALAREAAQKFGIPYQFIETGCPL